MRESLLTIFLPRGMSETGMSLMFAQPSGMPMIETNSGIDVTTCPMASHTPATTSQMILPTVVTMPAGLVSMTSRPNGHRASLPIRKESMPQETVMMSMQQMKPAAQDPSEHQST